MADQIPADDRTARKGFLFPTWAVGLLMLAGLLMVATIIYAISIDVKPELRVQIIYQAALVLAGLIGLRLAIWRSVTGHKQADAAIGQLKATQAQLKNTERQIGLAEAGAYS